MEHDHVFGRDLIEPDGLAHRLPGLVHESLGFKQDHLFRTQLAFAEDTLKLAAPRAKAVIFGNPINGHIADVVPVPGILRPRIAKPYE